MLRPDPSSFARNDALSHLRRRPTMRDAALVACLALIWAGAFYARWHHRPVAEPASRPAQERIQGRASEIPVRAPAPTPSPPGAEPLVPVYRFFDRRSGDRFYTTSAAEAAALRARRRQYREEGAPWSVPGKGVETQDVYRFFDKATRTHFYTANPQERDTIRARLPSYRDEGVAFQAYTSAGPQRYVVERFLETRSGVHLFTADAAEAERLRSGRRGGTAWRFEGPAFIVHQPIPDAPR